METGPETVHRVPSPLTELVDLALARAGMAQKVAASYMRMDQSQFAKALNGNGSLALQRLEQLPPSFWRVFVELLAERYDLKVQRVDRLETLITKYDAAHLELMAALRESRR